MILNFNSRFFLSVIHQKLIILDRSWFLTGSLCNRLPSNVCPLVYFHTLYVYDQIKTPVIQQVICNPIRTIFLYMENIAAFCNFNLKIFVFVKFWKSCSFNLNSLQHFLYHQKIITNPKGFVKWSSFTEALSSTQFPMPNLVVVFNLKRGSFSIWRIYLDTAQYEDSSVAHSAWSEIVSLFNLKPNYVHSQMKISISNPRSQNQRYESFVDLNSQENSPNSSNNHPMKWH